jgi:cyclophilin family peptidyl-prolyl cis-trans isomerase
MDMTTTSRTPTFLGSLFLTCMLAACGGGGGGDSGTPVAAQPSVSSGAAGTPLYSRPLLLTLNGSNLDAGITVTSPGCSGIARSTTAPNISTASVAYYTCTVSALGDQRFNVNRTSDGSSLVTVDYVVPVPRVSVAVSNGAGLTGSFVITLSPDLAPITTNNFLTYVHSNFYVGTVFHRHSPGFVLQGGGFAGPLSPTAPVPALKPTNPAIELEVGRGLSNVRWTVAMARTNVLNSATSQFFINLVDNTFLNTAAGGYAVFGNVSAGTDFITTALTGTCVAYPALQALPDCLFDPNLTITATTQIR